MEKILQYQGITTNYLYSNESTDPIHTDGYFEQLFFRVMRIWKNYSYLHLGYESLCKLYELGKIIQYTTMEMLKTITYYTSEWSAKPKWKYFCINLKNIK